jgi:hypothetical protein
MSSDEKWRAAVQRNIDAAKHLGEDTPVVIPIRRYQLKALDTKQLIDFLNMLLADAETVRAFRGRIGFDLEGFENEKRDPEDIPELRDYLRVVSDKFPYWFWFMETRSPRLKLLLHCLCDAEFRTDIGREHVLRKYNRDDLAHFMTKYGGALDELKERVGLSDAEVNARIKQIKKYFKKQGLHL